MINIYNTQNNTKYKTLQLARKDLIGEIDAVIQYDDHLNSTDDPLAKATWKSIKEEELVHIGELLALLNYLDSTQRQFLEKGFQEFNERMK